MCAHSLNECMYLHLGHHSNMTRKIVWPTLIISTLMGLYDTVTKRNYHTDELSYLLMPLPNLI